MRRSLSFDGILAALAVLSTSATSIGCSKSESARPEETAPEQAAATASAASPAAPIAAATAAEPAPAAAGPSVDAGKELPTAPSSIDRKKAAPATCGAQGCSPDMKKGK